jgi:hypothetical protein
MTAIIFLIEWPVATRCRNKLINTNDNFQGPLFSSKIKTSCAVLILSNGAGNAGITNI